MIARAAKIPRAKSTIVMIKSRTSLFLSIVFSTEPQFFCVFFILGIDILGLCLLYSVPQGEHKNIVPVKKAMLRHAGRISGSPGSGLLSSGIFSAAIGATGESGRFSGADTGSGGSPSGAKLGKLKKGKLTQHVILS